VLKPSDDTLPAGGGWFSSSGGTGAYSRTVVGLDWGRFRAEGRMRTAMATAAASTINGG
jgi:hypothetical protein